MRGILAIATALMLAAGSLLTATPSHAQSKGEIVWEKGRPETKEYENPKANYNPTNICWMPDGGFNVGDGYGSNHMLNYDKDGKLVKVFGGTGEKQGQLKTPHGQWVDDANPNHPMLLVCDRANGRLQTFTLDGRPVWAAEPRTVVLFPAHAKTRGKVVLLPDLHARVSLLDREERGYKPIVHLGYERAEQSEALRLSVNAGGDLDEAIHALVRLAAHPHDWTADEMKAHRQRLP